MPNAKRYAAMKSQKKQVAERVARDLQTRENDMVSMIWRLRSEMRQLAKSVDRDLRKMTGEYAGFYTFSGEEMQKIASSQNAIRVALAAHEIHCPGFEKRVLARVARWEALEASEKAAMTTKLQVVP